jgi:hypothetical protein
MLKLSIERGPGIAFWLLVMPAQMIGFTNAAIALAFVGGAVFFLGPPIWHHALKWHLARQQSGKQSLEPSHLIIAGLIGLVIFGAVALGGVIWRTFFIIPPPPTTIYVSAPVGGPDNIPTRLEANIPPPIHTDVAFVGARYLLLKELLPMAMEARKIAAERGPKARDALKPRDVERTGLVLHVVGQNGPERVSWDRTLKEIQRINDRAYKNRKIDLYSAPELPNTTLTGPDESVFASTDEATQRAKYNYRVLHFWIQNALKQTDALIADLMREQANNETALKKMAEGAQFLKASP